MQLLVLLLALGATASPALGMLSSAQVSSVFPGNVTLTGTMIKLPEFNLAVITNETHALFSLNATKLASEIGWMAIGVGTAMPNADILVAWPAPAISTAPWTLSHRTATGHVPPLVTTANASLDTAQFFTLLPQLCSNATMTPWAAVSWLRPLAMPAEYPSASTFTTIARYKTSFIYASASIPVEGVREGATIHKHDQPHGTIELDLSLAIDLSQELPQSEVSSGSASTAWSSEAWPAPRTNGGRGPLTRRDVILACHAAIGSIALLFFSPMAILIARYCRGLQIPWFQIHAAIQCAAFTMILVAFVLAVSVAGAPHFSSSHARLGLVIFALLLAQLAIGVTAHRTPAYINGEVQSDNGSVALASIKGKPLIRIIHIALGLGITILGWAQIRLGLEEWTEGSDSGRNVPDVVIIIFWILIGVESAEVFLGRFLTEEAAHAKALRSARSSLRTLSRATSVVMGTRQNSANTLSTQLNARDGAGHIHFDNHRNPPVSPTSARAPGQTSPVSRWRSRFTSASSSPVLERGLSQGSASDRISFVLPGVGMGTASGERRESDARTLVGGGRSSQGSEKGAEVGKGVGKAL